MSKHSKVLRRQARQIIYNVAKYMQKEKDEGVMNANQVQDRTANATGTSVRTVRNILAECKKSHISGFRTPGKRRLKSKPITGINRFDKGIIKRCIHNFHVAEKEMPTLRKLLTKFRRDIHFKGSSGSLNKIIRELGFKWKKTENKLKILIEKHSIRLKRIQYLRDLKKFREEGRELVYVGQSNMQVKYSQRQSEGSEKDLKASNSRGQPIFIVSSGSETGFLPNALFMFKPGSKAHEMNFTNYKKWLSTNIIPNLKLNSVIVLDDTAYNNKLSNPAPTPYSKIVEMQSWLKNKGIPYKDDMLKPQLYKLICENGGTNKTYIIDEIFNKYNHVVIRVPPAHPDLNPIDIALDTAKGYVAEKNMNNKTSHVMELVIEKLDLIEKNEWTDLCKKVEYIENQYRSSDHVIDAMTEELTIYNANSSESESESDIVSDGSDSDFESNMNDENELLVERIPKIESTSDSDD
ncbi:uncharacterized protein LOC125072952 [Vanessa atalanta]|uniref:uncharacterized protein LOC125072952 n=1 Tax=Vanessa atalanta TaxID=42275 RepID=UPI001FCE1A29|nr:uncharacterized protein LOC125072952 [Vanessa atalanta]